MSELRSRLDGLAGRISDQDDPFERLTGRRRARHRTRRIIAGILAIGVAIGGSTLAFRAFGRSPVDRPPSGVFQGEVRDSRLAFDVAPGARLRVGQSVTLHVAPGIAKVSAGSFSPAACGGGWVTSYPVDRSGSVRLAVGTGDPRLDCIVAFHSYPVRGWLVAYAPQRSAAMNQSYSRKLIDEWRRSGRITHLTIVPVEFVSAKEATHAGPYPRGAFEACPAMKSVIETDGAGADGVALQFSRLWASGRHAKARRYMAESARKLQNWAANGDPQKMQILNAPGKPSRHDGLVRYGCGPAVADRSWEVVIDDGTSSASLDFTIYLVRRASGWKVWGSY